MTYAERLAEFVRVTGSKPGEMNKGVTVRVKHDAYIEPSYVGVISLEPPSQSAGPGRCNRFTRAVALGDPSPCKLPANHEGPHEP